MFGLFDKKESPVSSENHREFSRKLLLYPAI